MELPIVRYSDKLRRSGAALYLGRFEGRPVHGSAEDHLLALGPTRCGKTSGLIIPSVGIHAGPAIVVSTREDIVQATAGARSKIAASHGGHVVEAALGGCTTGLVDAVPWSVTDGCDSWNVALDRAEILASTAIPESKDQFWRGAATDVLSGSLLGASLMGEDDRLLARRIRSANISAYHATVLKHYPRDHDAPFVFAGVSDPKAMAEDTRRSVFAVVSSQVLGPFRYEQSVSVVGAIDLAEFVQSAGTIYITIPWWRAKSLQPLVAAFIEAVVAAWRVSTTRYGTLLLALDEVANVAPLPNLPQIITAGAGDSIQCVLGMQEPAQATRWGSEAEVITGGPTHLAVYPGLRADFLEALAQLAPQAVQYETQVLVRPDTPHGPRFADEERLIRERIAIEAQVGENRARLRGVIAKRVGLQLAAERLREGVRNRLEQSEAAGPGSAVIEELFMYTSTRQVPHRRPSLEVSDLAEGTPGHFYLFTRGRVQQRAFYHWREDSAWSQLLAQLPVH